MSKRITEPETEKEITSKDEIHRPKAGFVRVVTSRQKGAGPTARRIFEFTDAPIFIEKEDEINPDGDRLKVPNVSIDRYFRKFEARKKNYARNTIIDIYYNKSEYTPPKFSDEMLKNGFEKDVLDDSAVGLALKELLLGMKAK